MKMKALTQYKTSLAMVALMISLLSFNSLFAAELAPPKPVTYENNLLGNGIISVSFEKDGKFSIHDAKTKEELLSGSRFGLPRNIQGNVVKISSEDVSDVLGKGKRVLIEVTEFDELGLYGKYGRLDAKRIYTYALYEDNPALVCGFGLNLPNFISYRLREATPLAVIRVPSGALRPGRRPAVCNGR